MRYLITEYDNDDERAYKERYNEDYDRRAGEWRDEYFGKITDYFGQDDYD